MLYYKGLGLGPCRMGFTTTMFFWLFLIGICSGLFLLPFSTVMFTEFCLSDYVQV